MLAAARITEEYPDIDFTSHVEIARYLAEQHQIISCQHLLYYWNGSYWEFAEPWLTNTLITLYDLQARSVPIKYSKHHHDEIKLILLATNQHEPDEFNGSLQYIPFRNGYYDTLARTLVDPIPELHFTYRFEWDYDASAECPRFQQYLVEVIPDERDRRHLLAYLRLLFTPDVSWQKAMVLQGDGNNGKSILMDLVKVIFGRLVTSLVLQNLGDRFNVIQMKDKLANIDDDLPQKALQEDGYFKKFVTAQFITGEFKNGDHCTFRNTCRHLYATNILPPPKFNQSSGFWRRWVVIKFPTDFTGREDHQLLHLLELEIPGIITYLLEQPVSSLGEVTIMETRRKWIENSDSAVRFAALCRHEETIGSVWPSDDLYDIYVGWSEDHGLIPSDPKGFGRRMSAAGFIRSRETTGERRYIYRNINIDGVNE